VFEASLYKTYVSSINLNSNKKPSYQHKPHKQSSCGTLVLRMSRLTSSYSVSICRLMQWFKFVSIWRDFTTSILFLHD